MNNSIIRVDECGMDIANIYFKNVIHISLNSIKLGFSDGCAKPMVIMLAKALIK